MKVAYFSMVARYQLVWTVRGLHLVVNKQRAICEHADVSVLRYLRALVRAILAHCSHMTSEFWSLHKLLPL